jgi:hypothetical protein
MFEMLRTRLKAVSKQQPHLKYYDIKKEAPRVKLGEA